MHNLSNPFPREVRANQHHEGCSIPYFLGTVIVGHLSMARQTCAATKYFKTSDTSLWRCSEFHELWQRTHLGEPKRATMLLLELGGGVRCCGQPLVPLCATLSLAVAAQKVYALPSYDGSPVQDPEELSVSARAQSAAESAGQGHGKTFAQLQLVESSQRLANQTTREPMNTLRSRAHVGRCWSRVFLLYASLTNLVKRSRCQTK